MKTNKLHTVASKQDGFVLIVLVIVILLAVSSYYFSSISLVEIQVNKIEKTQVLLKRAKQALLAYAMTNSQVDGDDAGKIGKLPCPDHRPDGGLTEGLQDGPCGGDYTNAMGYLPWRTLNMEILKDNSNSCLLYGVSPAYKSNPAAALNPDSFGQFQVVDSTGTVIQGTVPEDRPVAVIIAPGPSLPSQNRVLGSSVTCGSYYANVIANLLNAYLDDDGTTNNAVVDTVTDNIMGRFVQRYAGSDAGNNPLNDQIITITHKEFWEAMDKTIARPAFNFDGRMKNLTEAIAMCFAAYGANNPNKNLPMPAPLALAEYRRNIDYDDSGIYTSAFAGRLPYDVSEANGTLLNGNEPHIFTNTFCDNLNLPSTTGINETITFKNNSGSDNGEYFDLWQNWKDHFFYVVSEEFRPNRLGAASICSAVNCVEYKGTRYAALVIYSGEKIELVENQSRYSPPFDPDQKSNMSNYLEEDRDLVFPDDDGNGTYQGVGAGSNDFVVCIKEDMSVTLC